MSSIPFSRRRILLILSALTVAVGGVCFWLNSIRPEPEQLFQLALTVAHGKNPQEAIPLLDEVLAYEPGHLKALLYRGQLTQEQGDYDLALKFFGRVGDDSTGEGSTARYLEGTVWFAKNNARKTEQSFQRSIDINPNYLKPRESLVRLYAIQLRSDELRKQLLEIRRFRRWTFEELVVYQIANAKANCPLSNIPKLEAFVAADTDDVYSRLSLARHFMIHERLADAVKLLNDSLRRDPTDLRIKAILAESYLQQLDLKAARLLLQKPSPNAKSHHSWWRSHGHYAFEVEDWSRAIACFEQALSADRNDFAAEYMLGLAWQRIEKPRQASRQLKRARLTQQLSVTASNILRGDRKQTDLMAPIALKIGRLLMDLGRDDESVPWFEMVLSWQPQRQEAQELFRLAISHVEHRRVEDRRIAKGASTRGASNLPDTSQQTTNIKHATEDGGIGKQNGLASSILLSDDHAAAGIDFQYFNGNSKQKYLLNTLGGGVAVLDYDGDGWPDLYFPNGCEIPFRPSANSHTDRFYRNLGDNTYEEFTAMARLGSNQYGQGCAAADYDNDGFTDLFVANYGTVLVYHNNGDGTFSDVSQAAGVRAKGWSSSLALADLDRDGDLDLYVANYVRNPLLTCRDGEGRPVTCSPANFDGEQDLLYLNLGNGQFADVTEASGIVAPDGRGLGIIIADLDNDDWPDIYVANDGSPNFVFRNLTENQNGRTLRFQEVGLLSGAAMSSDGRAQAGMGIACADFDHDGRLDLYVTNFYRDTNTMYLNQGNLTFADKTQVVRLAKPSYATLGFGTQAVDLDRDGHCEIIVANGHIDDRRFEGTPWQMRPQLFRHADDGSFDEISQKSGDYFAGKYIGRAVARLDWNRDGLPDLVVVHQDRPVALLTNRTSKPGHAVVLELRGVRSNRDAIGTRILATVGGKVRMFEITGGDGFFASNERTVFVGMGAATKIDEIEIRWPSGRIDRWKDLPGNTRIRLIESQQPRFHPLLVRAQSSIDG